MNTPSSAQVTKDTSNTPKLRLPGYSNMCVPCSAEEGTETKPEAPVAIWRISGGLVVFVDFVVLVVEVVAFDKG